MAYGLNASSCDPLKRQISNGRTCSKYGIKHVLFVKKIMNVTTNSIEKRNTARLTGTLTWHQIVWDVSLFSKLY